MSVQKDAKKIIIDTIQRIGAEEAIDNTVSVFHIESDDLNEGFKNFMIILDSLEEENLKTKIIDLSFKNQVVIRKNF